MSVVAVQVQSHAGPMKRMKDGSLGYEASLGADTIRDTHSLSRADRCRCIAGASASATSTLCENLLSASLYRRVGLSVFPPEFAVLHIQTRVQATAVLCTAEGFVGSRQTGNLSERVENCTTD